MPWGVCKYCDSYVEQVFSLCVESAGVGCRVAPAPGPGSERRAKRLAGPSGFGARRVRAVLGPT